MPYKIWGIRFYVLGAGQYMEKLARNLMQLHDVTFQTNQPSAIFGSIGNLPNSIQRKKPYRIGMWPCLSKKMPEVVMGFWATVGYLLEETYQDVRVYFLARRMDDTDGRWSIKKSQFHVDDWALDDLDENVAIWGELSESDAEPVLTVFIENDLDETDEPIELTFRLPRTASFQEILSQITINIGNALGILKPQNFISFLGSESTDASVEHMLKVIFNWERKVFEFVAGAKWDDADILSDHQLIVEAAGNIQDSFSSWCLARATARTMVPGLSVIGEIFVDRLEPIVAACQQHPLAVTILAEGLYKLGETEQAFGLLERRNAQEVTPEVSVKLARFYVNVGKLVEAATILQETIELDVTSMLVYQMYGYVLRLIEQNELDIGKYVLLDNNIKEENHLNCEILATYNEILKLDPENLSALHHKLIQLMYLDEQHFWDEFEILLKHDASGLHVRDILESADHNFSLEPAVAKLQALAEKQPERVDVLTNLAVVYLSDELLDKALQCLAEAKQLANDKVAISDIEYLTLNAQLPGFEHQFGELSALLEAGRSAKSDDVDFLEEVVEIAPTFADGYVLLAKAYTSWDDSEAALEVMLDGQKQAPNHPGLLDLLAENLWDAGEKTLSFEYLNKGLEANPNYVPLLVRAALYLCENGQIENAKPYLARAELIAPRNPVFIEARNFISMNYVGKPNKSK